MRRLSKDERLSWKRHIDGLFAEGQSFVSFPLRVVFLPIDEQGATIASHLITAPSRAAILVSVSKKRFKRAVHRNRIKRLVRETYRLRKAELLPSLEASGKNLLLAFLYIDSELHPFDKVDRAMEKAIRTLRERIG